MNWISPFEIIEIFNDNNVKIREIRSNATPFNTDIKHIKMNKTADESKVDAPSPFSTVTKKLKDIIY